MGELAKNQFAILDNIIAEQGKDFVVAQIITRISEGHDPNDIAHGFGMKYVYLKQWLEYECSDDVNLALRARADILEHEATTTVNMADPDSVQVARLQADHKMKLAERFDRKRYGVKETQDTGGGATILPVFNFSFISAPQPATAHHEKVIIEHESEKILIERD